MRISEDNFLQQLNKKNEQALIYVMKNYGGFVKAVINRHLYGLGQYEEECIDDVFLAVWMHISSFNKEKNTFSNWIAGIARIKALDYVRKHYRRIQEISVSDEELSNIASNDGGEIDLMESFYDDVNDMLSCLNDKDKDIFYRLYVNEESIEQVERDLAIDKSVIYNHVSRGKKRIKKSYKANRGE